VQYTPLGNSGLTVSRLAFGASTFTSGDQSLPGFYKAGPETAAALVDQAIKGGITYFDTADVYANGQSEELLGAALKPHRQNVVLSTKVGNFGAKHPEVERWGLSRRHILWSIDQSLGRLGTDHVDAYIVHRVDPDTPLEETLQALDEVVCAGKAQSIGYSNWPAWLAAAAIGLQRANGWAQFSHGQMYYSLLGRDVERDTAAMMRHFGLGMSVWSPLAYGFLAGGYTPEDMARDDNRFGKTDWLRFDRERAFALLPLMREMADSKGCSMAQLAIAWLLAKDSVSTVLLGATKPHQLADNLGAAEIVLTEAELAQMDAATAFPPHYPSSNWVESMLPRKKK
jgi:aryl-alcohol dehydrogenase-like predicted oxidoreductase